jgi:hypothetical protein
MDSRTVRTLPLFYSTASKITGIRIASGSDFNLSSAWELGVYQPVDDSSRDGRSVSATIEHCLPSWVPDVLESFL